MTKYFSNHRVKKRKGIDLGARMIPDLLHTNIYTYQGHNIFFHKTSHNVTTEIKIKVVNNNGICDKIRERSHSILVNWSLKRTLRS